MVASAPLLPGSRVTEWRRSAAAGWTGVGLLTVAAAIVDLQRITASIWGDEAVSLGLARRPLGLTWTYLAGGEQNMALYYLLLHGWMKLGMTAGLPVGEAFARLPSVALALLGLLALIALVRRLGGLPAALLGGALYVLNFEALSVAAEARAYSLELLLTMLSWLALLSALETGRRRWVAAYGALTALLVYTHLFGALVAASQVAACLLLAALWVPWRDRLRQLGPALAGALALAAAACLPLLVIAMRHGPNASHVGPASLRELARLGWGMSGHNLAFAALLGVALAAAAFAVWRSWPAGARAGSAAALHRPAVALLLGCWLLVPIALSYAGSLRGHNLHLFSANYLVVIAPPLCASAALGVIWLPRRAARLALGAALVLAALAAIPAYRATLPRQDLSGPAAWVTQQEQPGDRLVCTSWSCTLGLGYYLWADHRASALLADTEGKFDWATSRQAPSSAAEVAGAARGARRVILVSSVLGADQDPIKRGDEEARAWLDANARLVATASFPASYGTTRVRVYETGA